MAGGRTPLLAGGPGDQDNIVFITHHIFLSSFKIKRNCSGISFRPTHPEGIFEEKSCNGTFAQVLADSRSISASKPPIICCVLGFLGLWPRNGMGMRASR
jgi:hypothetical protein